MINEGIYNNIAIALHRPPFRAVSLALLAQTLGAVKKRKRLGSKAEQISKRESMAGKGGKPGVEVAAAMVEQTLFQSGNADAASPLKSGAVGPARSPLTVHRDHEELDEAAEEEGKTSAPAQPPPQVAGSAAAV